MSAASASMQRPKIQRIRRRIRLLAEKLKLYANCITVSSSRTNQTPRVQRKRASSRRERSRCFHQRNAPAPAVNMKTGKQKWVIHRVRKRSGVVFERSVGEKIMVLRWKKSRT